MKVTLSFENTISDDVSIMVDALRASTTITLALNNFEKIIPCFTPEEGFELKKYMMEFWLVNVEVKRLKDSMLETLQKVLRIIPVIKQL